MSLRVILSMLDVSARVFEALSRKLSKRPFLASNNMELRFAGKGCLLIVTLSGFEAEFKGIVHESLILKTEKALDLYRDLTAISGDANLRISSFRPEAVQVSAEISSDLSFYEIGRTPEDIAKSMAERDGWSLVEAAIMWYFDIERAEIEEYADAVCEEVNETLPTLEKMGETVKDYKAYDVGFASIRKMWKGVNLEKDSEKKGHLLEDLISMWIRSDDNFGVRSTNYRTESEEIDIVVQNEAKTEFFRQLQSPLMLVECKNWTSNVGSKEIRDFAQKVQNRPRFLCKVGLMITTAMYTKDAEKELLGYRGKDFLIAALDGAILADALRKGVNFSDVCTDRIYAAGLR